MRRTDGTPQRRGMKRNADIGFFRNPSILFVCASPIRCNGFQSIDMARRLPESGEGRTYDLLSAEPANTLFFVTELEGIFSSVPGHLHAHNPLTVGPFLPNVFSSFFARRPNNQYNDQPSRYRPAPASVGTITTLQQAKDGLYIDVKECWQ